MAFATNCPTNAADGGDGMGIGSLGSPTLIIKRKYRWICNITTCGQAGTTAQKIPPYLVKIASRPDLTIEDTELNFLNEKIWIPGKAAWETMTVTFIDAIDTKGSSNVNGALLSWIASVYDFTDPGCRWQNTMRQDYTGLMALTLLDGCGTPLELWTITDAWPTSVKFGELDYTSSDTVDIELTLRYSRVSYEALCGNVNVKRCPCTPCTTSI